jgi:hypothetical protein
MTSTPSKRIKPLKAMLIFHLRLPPCHDMFSGLLTFVVSIEMDSCDIVPPDRLQDY